MNVLFQVKLNLGRIKNVSLKVNALFLVHAIFDFNTKFRAVPLEG